MKPIKELANAAASGDLKQVKALVRKNSALATDWQPIMNACYSGHAEVVAFLLEIGADPNVLSKSAHHYRPLHRVVEYKKTAPRGPGHLATVEILLKHGADPMMRGAWYRHTAIAVAAMGGELQFVPMLLEKAPKQQDLFTACVLGNEKRVGSLMKKDAKAAAGAVDENDWTALQYVVRSNAGKEDPKVARNLLSIAETLIAAGAAVDGLLDHACWAGNLQMVELLLAHGGKLKDGDTLNHLACDGQFDLLDALVADGVDLEDTRGTEHHGGYIPFGCTLTMRSFKGATWFLDHGADPNKVGGKKKETALHVAVRSGCGEPLVRLLIERGAKIGAKDIEGATALDIAKRSGKAKIAAVLEECNIH